MPKRNRDRERDHDEHATEKAGFAESQTAARTSAGQVETLLGELEAAIMAHCWAAAVAAGALDGAPQTVAEVHQALTASGRRCAYTTVMTVMGRLVEKGLLRRSEGIGRSGPGSSYHYWQTQDEDAFIADASRQRVSALIATFGDVALAQFADALGTLDPARLATLVQLSQSAHIPVPEPKTQPANPTDDAGNAGGHGESGGRAPDAVGREKPHES